jgi:copper chaperone CopZ
MAAMRAAILLVGILCVSCASAAAAAAPAPAVPALPMAGAAIAPHEAELRLDVIELSCHSCAGQIADGTSRIPGVLRVSAQILDRVLVVKYDPTRLSEAALIAAIDRVVDRLAE